MPLAGSFVKTETEMPDVIVFFGVWQKFMKNKIDISEFAITYEINIS